MKNYLICLAAVLSCVVSVMLTSCKRGNNEELMKELLVGKWEVTYVEEGYDQTIMGSEWWYEADGSFTNVQGDESMTGTYQWNGNELVMTINDAPWSAIVTEITRTGMKWTGPQTEKEIRLERL